MITLLLLIANISKQDIIKQACLHWASHWHISSIVVLTSYHIISVKKAMLSRMSVLTGLLKNY